jgi:HK97 family phage portal protein
MNWIKRMFLKAAQFFPASVRFPFSMGGWANSLRRVSVENDPMSGYAGWVYAALSKRAKRVAAIQLQLFQMARNGDLAEIEDHELLALLYRANPVQSKYQFFYTIEMFLGIWGSAPILLDRQGGRRIVNLWPLRPDLLRAIGNDAGQIVKYEYRVGNVLQTFDAQDVVPINEPNSANILLGFSPMQAAALEIDADMGAAVWNKALVENWAEPGGVLFTEQSLKDAEFERVKKDWSERRAGPLNAGRTAVLEKGLKYEAVGRSPKEMDHVESRKFHRNAITVILGVPMALMTSEDVNLANAEVAERVFAKDTVEPQYQLITSQLNEFLVPFYGEQLWLSYEDPVPEDVTQKVTVASAGEGRWLTVNEARDMFNMEPLEGGDAIFKPIGVMPQVGQGITEPMPAGTEGAPQQAARPQYVYEKLQVGAFKKATRKERQIRQSIYARTNLKRRVVEGMGEKVYAILTGKMKEAEKAKLAQGDIKLKLKGAKRVESPV